MAAFGAATASAPQMVFGGEDQKPAFPIKIFAFGQFFHFNLLCANVNCQRDAVSL